MEPTGNNNSRDCGVCLESYKELHLIAPCGHSFCKGCIDKLVKNECPSCRGRIQEVYKNLALISGPLNQYGPGGEGYLLAGRVVCIDDYKDSYMIVPCGHSLPGKILDELKEQECPGCPGCHTPIEGNYKNFSLMSYAEQSSLGAEDHSPVGWVTAPEAGTQADGNASTSSESTSTSSLSSPSQPVSTEIDVLTAQYLLEELGGQLNGHLSSLDFEKMKPLFPMSMRQEWEYIMYDPAFRERRLFAALFQRKKLHVFLEALQQIGYHRLVDLINAHDSAPLFNRVSTSSESTSTSSLSSPSQPVSTEMDVLTAQYLLEELGGQLNGHLSLLDFKKMKPLFPMSMRREWKYIMHEPALRERRLLAALFQRKKLHVLLHALRRIGYHRLADIINSHDSAGLFRRSPNR